jgi:DNA-binding CsgD family transcriptional regulator
VAAVAYAEASPRARQVLHGRLARVVDAPEDRARHLGLSARGPDPTVAALLDRAAAGAHRDGPAGLAAELADLALRLTPPEDRDHAVRRRVAAAGYHLDAGDAPGARALVEAALAGGGPERLRGDLHRLLGVARWHDGAGSPEEPLERALQEAGEDDALRAAVLRDLAWTGLRGGRLAEGSARAQAALRLAERVGDRGLVAEAAAAFALLEAVQGRGGHRWDLEAGTEHGSRPERPGIHSHPAAVLGVILKWEDRFEAARRWLEAAHEEARRRGDLGCLPFLLHHLCELECWAGDLPRAARWAAAQQEAVARAGQEGFRPAALHAGALVDAYRGRAEAARGAATEGAALAERADDRFALMQNLAVLGFLELSAGRPAAARRHLATVTDLAAAAGVGEPGAIRFQADAVEALVELERLDEAERLLGRLEQQGTALDRPWALATAARCRGLLRAAQGDHECALESLRSAVQAHRRLPHPLELGRTMLATGSVQRRCRHRQSARTSLATALRTFEAVGAGLWSERVRSELDRNGLGRRLLNGLTPTEHRVSELVLEGRTNREIARALFMGQKTVETHLSSIYRKLGVRSRLELARSLSSGAGSQGEP